MMTCRKRRIFSTREIRAMRFNAAEQIVEYGRRAVEELRSRFPGRIFIDRYEYTPGSLPPVDEHGPVIAALCHLGEDAVPVARDHLDESSVELRFYATLLFKSLPLNDVTEALQRRLYDRDKMIRDVAAQILVDRTDEAYRQEELAPKLRREVEAQTDDLHVETSASLLGKMRDEESVPMLIDALSDAEGRLRTTLHEALQRITYKSLAPSSSEWRNWSVLRTREQP